MTTAQRTNIRHRETGELYEAVKHDGSDEQAKRITQWVNSHRGRAKYYAPGEVDYDLHQAFVLLLRDSGDHEFIRRGFWVIRRESDNSFFSVFGDDLTEHFDYIPSNDPVLGKLVGDLEKAFHITQEDLDDQTEAFSS